MVTSQVIGKPWAFASRTSATPAADDRCDKCTRAPDPRTNSQIVCRAMVSADTGTPDTPSRDATAPLAATPPLAIYESCGRSHTAYPYVVAYCSARKSVRV